MQKCTRHSPFPFSPTLTYAVLHAQLRLTLQKLIVQFESAEATTSVTQHLSRVTASQMKSGRTRHPVRDSPKRQRSQAQGFRARQAQSSSPALGAFTGVMRDLLVTMDLHHGIRYGAQLQTAKVFLVALGQLQQQLSVMQPALRRTQVPARRGTRLTKREKQALGEISRAGLIGPGAVDPSPQRTTIAVAAVITLLYRSPRPGT